jgi:2',3'-cyclic-nucleotide 2'-phosphodiesterase (5'-nucleotidase family)
VVETITGAQLQTAMLNGFAPKCNPAVATGRFPQVSGLKITFICNGTTPEVTGMFKTPQGISGPQIPIGPTDTVRIVTNDFMFTGGDGYTVLKDGTDVRFTGELLLDVAINYVTANSPVAPVVEGRIVGP